MVTTMNKTEFINELAKQLSYSQSKCSIVNEVLENNFFISKKNKDKIVTELMQRLEIDEEEAIRVYDVAIKIINDEIKNKLKHPFKSKD